MNPAANRQLCYFILIALFCLLASQARASAAATLHLDAYLGQVKLGNTGVRGSIEAGAGAEMRSRESELLTAPTVFATTQYTRDGKPPTIPLFEYSFQDTYLATLGVSQTTTYGLTARLSYNLVSIDYVNPSSSLFQALGPAAAAAITGSGASGFGGYNTATTLELSQSLWGNGFGRATRANQELLEAQALASNHANRFAAQSALTDAESAYWRLVSARQAVAVQKAAIERARQNYEWSARRARMQLADKSDALQARAVLDIRSLDLQASQDEEHNAARAFNTARGVASDRVGERLPDISPEAVARMRAPARVALREDVKAAAEQQRAVIANTSVALERDSPTLDVFGSIALNGKDTSLGTATGQAFSFSHPTEAIGLRFSAPIDFAVLKNTRAGWSREQAGAELNYQRKIFEQDQSWQDLTQRLIQAKRRLQLARSVEMVQKNKMENERSRYKTGRTTTFQVLTFEQDFYSSQISRIRAQSDVLTLISQMKLFGDAS